MRQWLAVAVALAIAGAANAQAQAEAQTPPDPVQMPVLIVDSDRLYQESRYGQQIRAELDAQAAALKAENDRIVAALTEEERSLTTRRPTMAPDAFRQEAKDFDSKVQGIRRARDAKEVALQTARATAQKDFFAQVQAIVGQLMLERGAAVTFDQRSVFVALSAADVTEEAIARIDAAFLDAPAPVLPEADTLLEGAVPDADPAPPEDPAPEASLPIDP